MTTAQENKLASFTNVLNTWSNKAGQLVIELKYGTRRYQQLFIGVRGGINGRKVYSEYDFSNKKPLKFLFSEID